jgi:hypothetical protein
MPAINILIFILPFALYALSWYLYKYKVVAVVAPTQDDKDHADWSYYAGAITMIGSIAWTYMTLASEVKIVL